MNSSFVLETHKMEPTNITHNNSEPYEEFYNNAQFITGLILYPIICAIGITGNILTLVVLSHKKMVSSTNVYLSALAVADLFKLFNDLLYFVVSILMRTHPDAANHMMGLMYPISHYILNESVCVSSWLTVCVGVERYIAVCHPGRAKEMCTVYRAKFVSIIFFVLLSTVAIPSGLRYQRKLMSNPETNATYYEVEVTELGKTEPFMTVYTWIINLLRSVIPLCILIIVNACIIRGLRKERVKGKKMSARNRITFMLIIVIIVFLICITPDAVMSTVFGWGYVEAPYLVKGVREFTDTLLSVNSAINFIIYCLCSKVFRDVFSEIFCGTRMRKNYTEVAQKQPPTALKGITTPTTPPSPASPTTPETASPNDENGEKRSSQISESTSRKTTGTTTSEI